MEKFAVVSIVNGTFKIDSEWDNNLNGARVAFHQRCAALWSAQDVVSAVVRLVNSDFLTYTNYEEHIGHEVQPEEEPEA